MHHNLSLGTVRYTPCIARVTRHAVHALMMFFFLSFRWFVVLRPVLLRYIFSSSVNVPAAGMWCCVILAESSRNRHMLGSSSSSVIGPLPEVYSIQLASALTRSTYSIGLNVLLNQSNGRMFWSLYKASSLSLGDFFAHVFLSCFFFLFVFCFLFLHRVRTFFLLVGVQC